MTRALRTLAVLLMAIPAMLVVASPAANAATTEPYCVSGQGCLHSSASYSSPVNWWRVAYGTYAIYGWNGSHVVENAQSQGAYMQLLDINHHVRYTLEDGQSGRPPRSMTVDMGPIYYVKLSPGPSCWPRCT